MSLLVPDLRIHAPGQGRPRPGGEFVLYWMQGIAMRVEGNFAFNFAAQQADLLGVPLLVYQGLRSDYPWASDRIHTYILESVAELQREFGARGVQYAFHLALRRWGAGAVENKPRSPLVQLAERAAVVVTEFSPTFIHPRQTKRLREKVATPVIAVDTAGIVPLAAITKAHPTARGFRTDIQRHFPEHFRPVGTAVPKIHRKIDLPFEPTVVRDIPALVAGCDIDHSVPPSPTIRGGTSAARARLAHFLKHGLHRYSNDRGDPNVDATSRLSAHLHFGTIGIHEVLFAAKEAGTADEYAKFEDEAVTWRELAWNYCYHEPKHRTVAGIPAWAVKELSDHEADARHLYTDEQIEQGLTGDELWNAAQRSLVRDGELHNYVRMLWGKCVLPWTRNAVEALRVLEHLNHKYALDGRDPGSYGGIFWIFGKFDRPFYRRPVFGTVRYMSTRAAKDKFDVPAYIAHSSQTSLQV
ncbi:MAG TPA: hypothetical protein VL295_08710 [Gemmatimonadales bacterium]|nr:hypothetical protein [Gemmatimonadales bacterium]